MLKYKSNTGEKPVFSKNGITISAIEDVEIKSLEYKTINTGLTLITEEAIQETAGRIQYVMLLSGLQYLNDKGIFLQNKVISSGEEIIVTFYNASKNDYMMLKNDNIIELVLSYCTIYKNEFIEEAK